MADTPQSYVRKPRGKVLANGTALRFNKFEVINNGNHSTDTFQIELPLFDPQAPHDWKWWADQTDIEIEVQIGFEQADGSAGNMTQLIVGPVDAISMSPLAYGSYSGQAAAGRNARSAVGSGGMIKHEDSPQHPAGAVMTIRGRDYSGQLIDSQMSTQYAQPNLKSSDVIGGIAKQVPALKLQMGQASDAIGDNYDSIQGRLFLGRSAWDVITALADHEGFRAMVRGKNLVVGPPPTPDASSAFELNYTPASNSNGSFTPVQSNCVTLRLARALSIAKGVDVFVQAYDAQTGRPASRKQAKVRSSSRSSQSASQQAGTPTTYTQNMPGMTADQATKHAQAKASQIAQFEREIEFQIPGDPSLTVDRMVKLTGTGTSFDQAYSVDQLSHMFDIARGYVIEGRARNKSSDTQITAE